MKHLFTGLAVSFFTLLFGAFTVHAQEQFKWVKGGGSAEVMSSGYKEESVKYMCTDPNGNIYALSIVGGSTTSTPIYADTFYRPTGAYGNPNNILLTSYKCDGTMRWAKLIASTDEDWPNGIVADNAGHIYVAGHFQHVGGSSTFHIGYDTSITGYYYLCTGLIQFDTNGHYNWVRFVGTNTLSTLAGLNPVNAPLVLDGANNVHLLPYIKSKVPLMPGDTSHYGVYDMVYNPSGTLLSAVRLDMDSQWFANRAVIDPITNKLYVSGEINQYIYGGFLTDTFYAAAFDASRHKLWQYFCGGNGALGGVTFDQNKHLYFSGASDGTPFSFNGASVPAGDLSIVMKTDTNGTVNWIKSFSVTGSSINGFTSITALPNNKVAAFGTFAGTVTDGKISLSTPPGEGYTNYLVILDSGMDVQTAQIIHGDGFYNGSSAITADKTGNIYVGGQVADSVWATGPKIPAYHSVGGGTDFFVMKYGVDCSCTTMPISMFTYSGTHTLSVSYTGTMTGLDSVVWNFADGSATVNALSASHTYTLAGTYRVTATVYTTCGNDIHGENVVIVCGLPPTAAFTESGSHTISFTYTGTTSTVDSTVWNFGDGSPSFNGSTASHTYAAVGTYTACVTAWSVCGNNTACKTVTVVCIAAPATSFTKTGTYMINGTYTGTTTAIDSIVWNFGDGSPTVKGTTASHTYAAIGTYTICVTAYNPCGSNTSCSSIAVPCIAAPAASFTDTGHITVGATYTGTTTAIDSTVWNFGDGSATVKGTAAAHTYTAAGTYHVCVTAYNPCGSNQYCLYDTVRCVTAPVVSFTDTGTHKSIGFAYTGTTAGIDSIVWEFGDGASGTGNTPIHTYSANATYHVCATVYTPCGIDSACTSVTVHSLGISDPAFADIRVFPNPANDELNITGVMENNAYRLLNVTGISLDQGIFHQGNNSIPMQRFAPGIYILEMTSVNGERSIVRVIKD